ncbi:uncharacterized protein OCT59_011854 [Rhizophagus irregularis]|uniref:Uncharacterized protein n=1 Tax=Rhizophagus irregularis (strain DAOM 181602 / DAOM 197198 / MUCL 43194) TaxID=747089 RepID=U9TUM7_RHIID|nr:hypothetical protein OCT59_011854 [Rhizophagus irregularis]CAB5204419.1 unnamed protein product [Rhizophagus irregularis]
MEKQNICTNNNLRQQTYYYKIAWEFRAKNHLPAIEEKAIVFLRLNLGYEEIRIDGLHEEWQDEVMRIREDFPLDEIAKKLEKVEL